MTHESRTDKRIDRQTVVSHYADFIIVAFSRRPKNMVLLADTQVHVVVVVVVVLLLDGSRGGHITVELM